MYIHTDTVVTETGTVWNNYVCTYFVAPVCFNTTYCGGESVSDDLLSYEQCCFELSGVSFASPGQCVLCPKSGTYICKTYIRTHTCT